MDFVSEIENLYATGVRTFVEIGPKSVLTGLIPAILQDRDINAWALDASAGKSYGITDLAKLLGRLASLGYPVALPEWENTRPTARKSRMNVLLSGANYRTQRTEARELGIGNVASGPEGPMARRECGISTGRGQRTVDPSSPGGFDAAGRGQRTLETVPQQRSQPSKLSKPTRLTNEQKSNMRKDNSEQSGFILDALKVVQEGLKSMQHLQSQTAAAHQKFLETQTEANRSLQEMMRNTQRLAEQSLGLPSEPLQPVSFRPLGTDPRQESPAQELVRPPVKFDNIDGPMSPPISANPEVAPTFPAGEKALEIAANGYAQAPETRDSALEKIQPPNQVQQTIEATLLEVVSQLTGYPLEMLGLDMDIEAELGIDSIKRVEILSTLEEKMPELPTVSPEIMGSLKTLGQIVEYLTKTGSSDGIEISSEYANSAKNSAVSDHKPPAGVNRPMNIEATLLEVVSQLTGYPLEMLGLDWTSKLNWVLIPSSGWKFYPPLKRKCPSCPPFLPKSWAV